VTQARHEADLGHNLNRQGRFEEALERFRRAIQLQPRSAELHYYFAAAAWNCGQTNLAEKHFLESLDLGPGRVCVHQALTLWYLQQDRSRDALKHAQAAVTLDPGNEETNVAMAEVLIGCGRYVEARAILKPFVEKGRPKPFLARAAGKLAMKDGREHEALALLQKSLRSGTLSLREKSQLHSTASNLFEKIRQYDDAFLHAKQAKESLRPPYDPQITSLNASKCIQYFDRAHLNALPRASHGNSRPVFIIGMPRSGTSLVEQILASHPAVHGAGELSRLSEIIQPSAVAGWSEGKFYPFFLDNLSVRRANQMADEYLKTINAINTSATYVTDKMPQNFVHLGTVQLLFPQCKVIHCLRDPRDTCLSCYMTTFLSGQEFSHDLSHLAQYYRDYERLMAHWKATLDLPILDVSYEDLVTDQQGQSRRMLEFLGLPWHDSCLNFHQTNRPVATASRDQVRSPIYNSSIGRWKHYEKHIPELLSLIPQ
jgi:tetratricopeptide (TPR) repeat protein